jgi:protein-disulfide isomerase/uncharacterized membrane protein
MAKTSRILGWICLLLAWLSCLMLVIQYFGGLALPGCGVESACASLARSPFGNVPVLDWPVSFLGLAWFSALLALWLTPPGKPSLLKLATRCAAAASLGWIGVMVWKAEWCAYCLAVHIANLVFTILVERLPQRPSHRRRTALLAAATFVLCTGLLAVLQTQKQQAVQEQAQVDLQQSTAEIIARTLGDPADSATSPATFTGRYPRGPEAAAIRLVLFTDYQCQDCQRIHKDVQELWKQRDDLNISSKHFPFHRACNPHVNEDRHSQACQAARAAEAAGMVAGVDGFWTVNDWLFDCRGRFNETDLLALLQSKGYDVPQFQAAMGSEEVSRRIRADVDEGYGLGLHYTPMIFLNGVELKGIAVPRALIHTVERLATSNPQPQGADLDRPPAALDKFIADWRDQPRRLLPPGRRSLTLGGWNAKVKVVLWGDYQEEGTREADRKIRELIDQTSDVGYSFRHFPFNQSCNSAVPRTKYPLACQAVAAVEAAYRLGGPGAFWKMHAWVMEYPDQVGDAAALDAAAESFGLTKDSFRVERQSPPTLILNQDIRTAQGVGLRHIPWIYINDRYVPRWTDVEGHSTLAKLVENASAGGP